MNLITIKSKLAEKDQKRNRLFGQKEMSMKTLKTLGFVQVAKAEGHSKKLTEEIEKMKKSYGVGCEKFKTKYAELLA